MLSRLRSSVPPCSRALAAAALLAFLLSTTAAPALAMPIVSSGDFDLSAPEFDGHYAANVSFVPEPGTATLVLGGLVLLAQAKRGRGSGRRE